MKKLRDGKTRTRVIVRLQDSNLLLSQNVRNEVIQRLKNHLKKFDKNEVVSNASFTYLSGFGAEVTAVGLEKLADDPDVISIEEDVLLTAHLNQGIPLVNAVEVRNTSSGGSAYTSDIIQAWEWTITH